MLRMPFSQTPSGQLFVKGSICEPTAFPFDLTMNVRLPVSVIPVENDSSTFCMVVNDTADVEGFGLKVLLNAEG